MSELNSPLIVNDLAIKAIAGSLATGGHLPQYIQFFHQICLFKEVPMAANIERLILSLQEVQNLENFLFMRIPKPKIDTRTGALKPDPSQLMFEFDFDQLEGNSFLQYGSNDIPVVYHTKVLELILLLLENSDQGARFFMQKLKGLLPAKYLFKILTSQGDIFANPSLPSVTINFI